jgi:hypothetical protein
MSMSHLDSDLFKKKKLAASLWTAANESAHSLKKSREDRAEKFP